MQENTFPFRLEDLASVVQALQVRGDARAIATVLAGTCEPLKWDTDFGIDHWCMSAVLPVTLFYAMTEEEHEEAAKDIAEASAGWPEDTVRLIESDGCIRETI